MTSRTAVDDLVSGPFQGVQSRIELTDETLKYIAPNGGVQFGYVVGLTVLSMLFATRSGWPVSPKAVWPMFIAFACVGYHMQPEMEDPSIFITYGAGLELLSFILLWGLPRDRSGDKLGAAPSFALLMMVVLVGRLVCTSKYQGYLPTDMTGDGLYQMLEAFSLFLAVVGLARTVPSMNDLMTASISVAIAVVFSNFVHGDLDGRPLADRVWAASIYAEVLAWTMLCREGFRAGRAWTVNRSFLFPALGQAAFRTAFWGFALKEIAPLTPYETPLMVIFPETLVCVHATTTA